MFFCCVLKSFRIICLCGIIIYAIFESWNLSSTWSILLVRFPLSFLNGYYICPTLSSFQPKFFLIFLYLYWIGFSNPLLSSHFILLYVCVFLSIILSFIFFKFILFKVSEILLCLLYIPWFLDGNCDYYFIICVLGLFICCNEGLLILLGCLASLALK